MIKSWLPYLRGVWFSLPLQLLLLHFRKYQVILLFWVLLFAVVDGSFLYKLGAQILYLYPEYLGKVGFLPCLIVGVAIGIFVMSWNITTFILHSRQIEFLATTTKPFLKYCFNNALLPLIFLFFYLVKAVRFSAYQELLSAGEILWQTGGFLTGLIFSLLISFSWFFGADRTIYRYTSPGAIEHLEEMKNRVSGLKKLLRIGRMRVDWYLTPSFKLRQPRDTRHYAPSFIQRIFKQHHLSAMLAIMLAFISLIISGYFMDNRIFQVPAAASITVIFAILIAVVGAVAYFLGQWTIPITILAFLGFNWLYVNNILDPRNKAYGLNYEKEIENPEYSKTSLLAISHADSISADSLAFIKTLNHWKAKQETEKPTMILTCVTGGGTRSATFTTQVMWQLDSITNGQYFQQTMLIAGASGGIMGASWYRELKYREAQGILNKAGIKSSLNQISIDLLNSVFSSFAVRDLLAPPRRFRYEGIPYIKDRGYAFEEALNKNTYGWLDKPLDSYQEAEKTATIPTLLLNSVVTADGRSLLMSTQPVRYMMRPVREPGMGPVTDADAVCFRSLFANRQPGQLRFLTGVRMSATFPYVLPNVWLPTKPVIDVMDAGFRDNTGIETSLKMIEIFKDWIRENCGKVLIIEIRDKPPGGWNPDKESKNILELITKPATLTQNNLFRFQEYHQYRHMEVVKNQLGSLLERVVFEYKPQDKNHPASLSFHLTQREKRDLISSLSHPMNSTSFSQVQQILAAETAAYQPRR